jgi:uncharacterized metal-binding protein
MPSGKTHLKIEAALLFEWTALTGYALSQRAISAEGAVAFTLAYAFSMLFLSPDLDLVRSRSFRRWGVVRWLWAPYAGFFRHRGLSHHPLVGPLTRVIYFGGILVLVWMLVGLAVGRAVHLALPPAEIVAAVAVGLYLPNLTHIVADGIGSWWKRKGRRSRL